MIKGALAMKASIKVAVLVAGVAAAWFFARGRMTAPPSAAPVAMPGASAARPGPTPVRAPAALPRLDKQQRAELLQRIERAQPRTVSAPSAAPTGGVPAGPEGDLDAEYIRERIIELKPMLMECYVHALRERPDVAGKLMINFTIVGEPGIGGLVSESAVDAEESTLSDPEMRECVQETMYAAQFRAPAAGGDICASRRRKTAAAKPASPAALNHRRRSCNPSHVTKTPSVAHPIVIHGPWNASAITIIANVPATAMK